MNRKSYTHNSFFLFILKLKRSKPLKQKRDLIMNPTKSFVGKVRFKLRFKYEI